MVELDVSITTSSEASKSKISQWTNLQVIALGVLWRHLCILYRFTAPNQTSAVGFFLLKRTSSTGFDSLKKIGASSHPHAGLSLVLPILKPWSSGSDTMFQIQKPLSLIQNQVPFHVNIILILEVLWGWFLELLLLFKYQSNPGVRKFKNQRYQMGLGVHPLISGGIMPGSLQVPAPC